jgi:hypothetical protein
VVCGLSLLFLFFILLINFKLTSEKIFREKDAFTCFHYIYIWMLWIYKRKNRIADVKITLSVSLFFCYYSFNHLTCNRVRVNQTHRIPLDYMYENEWIRERARILYKKEKILLLFLLLLLLCKEYIAHRNNKSDILIAHRCKFLYVYIFIYSVSMQCTLYRLWNFNN